MQLNYSRDLPVSPPLKRPTEAHSTFVASGWRDVNGLGSIRAAVNIYLRNGWIFNGVFLHVRENEDRTRKRWVEVPSIKQPDGTFRPLVEFSTPEARRSFNIACLAAIDELLRPGGSA